MILLWLLYILLSFYSFSFQTVSPPTLYNKELKNLGRI